jgi:hypothetical protein
MKMPLIIFLSLLTISCLTDVPIINNHSSKDIIENHLISITKMDGYRNYQNTDALNYVAGYIYSDFSKYCDTVYYQPYIINGVEYKNVIGSVGVENEKRIIVGAHYDVCGNQEGADDNATGVVGILELARLLKDEELKYRIDFVAYTLEEPPFFRSDYMGSFVHAKSLNDEKTPVEGMICLEMIGYYSEEENSQQYPLAYKKIVYGNKGNFIMIIQKQGNGKFGDEIKSLMKNAELIDTKSIKAPAIIPGIDFSDHMNYWKFGYSALMITNTAFYRNKNYHEATDRLETLNTDKMASVIDEVCYAIINLN